MDRSAVDPRGAGQEQTLGDRGVTLWGLAVKKIAHQTLGLPRGRK